MSKHVAPVVAYSYIRFSTRGQMKGDSLRRQAQAVAAWCERNGAFLDESKTFHDLGRSAYLGEHRKNPDRHALAAFLKMVEEGDIARGSYLVVENLDRLTREHIQPALLLCLGLLQAGIRIVQLMPAEIAFDDQSDAMAVMLMILELSRGNGESRAKSERLSASWANKRAMVQEQRAVATAKVPAWIEVVGRVKDGIHAHGGKLRLIPERAAVVRRIFDLAGSGFGLMKIVQALTADGLPTWGGAEQWSGAYVRKILTGRAAVGEFQPRKGLQADGKPISGYYPPVVNEASWQRAQNGLASRRDRPGRTGERVASLFTGFTWDALTGGKLLIVNQVRGEKGERFKRRALMPAHGKEGIAPCVSFPYEVFEQAILGLLREVDPADVIGEDPPSAAAGFAAELAAVEGRMASVEGEMAGDGEDVPALARVLRTLEAKRQDLTRALREAQHKEANPRAAAWGAAQSLLEVANDEPRRLRLRALLGTLIESIWVLTVPLGWRRYAAVQVRFAGGGQRDYLIFNRPAGYGHKAEWWAKTLAGAVAPGEVDLRDRADAERLYERLSKRDPSTFTAQ